MKNSLLFAVLCLISFPLQAQERTAAGSLDTQMTWSTLKNLTDDANAKSTAAHSRIDQMEKCGAKGMLYSPSAAGADKDGCKSVSPKLTNCHDRAGYFGVHVYCGKDQVVRKVCSAGRDPDCIAAAGTLMTSGSVTRDGWIGPKTETTLKSPAKVFTVITCCTLE